MEYLFTYNTRLSFGLGALHFSVKKDEKGRCYYHIGTPQHIGKAYRVYVSDEQEKQITSLPSCGQNYEYIRFSLLKLN